MFCLEVVVTDAMENTKEIMLRSLFICAWGKQKHLVFLKVCYVFVQLCKNSLHENVSLFLEERIVKINLNVRIFF